MLVLNPHYLNDKTDLQIWEVIAKPIDGTQMRVAITGS